MDKMREEFEAWINSETGFDCFRTNYQMTKPEDQQYMCHSTTLAWRAWKASRALLCVQMPRCCNEEQDSYRLNIIDSLDDAGVRHE